MTTKSRQGSTDGASRRIALPGGITLAIEERGSDGVPILLLHGYPLDRSMWRAQIDGLRGHRVIALDMRGTGESDSPDGPATMATYADDIAALLDELQLESVVVCGLSMGGYVAFEFVRRYPDRVRGLVLMDTKATADTAKGKVARDSQAEIARTRGVAAIAETMGTKLFADGVPAAVRDRIVSQMKSVPASGVVAALGAMRDRADMTTMLAMIDVPTLVVVGSHDKLTPPADAEAIASGIEGAQLLVIDGAGHMPPVERPDETTAALQNFLDVMV